MADSLHLIIFLTAFMALTGFLSTMMPPALQFATPFDLVWFTGSIIGISGACVIATGLPCAVALAVFGLASIWQYLIVSVAWVKLLIFTPIMVGFIWEISRMARGH
jgi:hypothetical protein